MSWLSHRARKSRFFKTVNMPALEFVILIP
jgi:hypothetical protein